MYIYVLYKIISKKQDVTEIDFFIRNLFEMLFLNYLMIE